MNIFRSPAATPVVSLGEGNTPLIPCAETGGESRTRLRSFREVRRPEPDLLLQGSRHDGGSFESGGAGDESRDLRFDRKHLRFRGGIRGARGNSLRGNFTGGKNRQRKTGSGFRLRREGRCH